MSRPYVKMSWIKLKVLLSIGINPGRHSQFDVVVGDVFLLIIHPNGADKLDYLTGSTGAHRVMRISCLRTVE